MPELPEVETIRRGLAKELPGSRIERVWVGDARILQTSPRRLAGACRGQQVLTVDRRGKFLILELQRHDLIFHLGMTGQLTLRDPRRPDAPFQRHPVTGLERSRQHAPDRHTHLQLWLGDGRALLFRDVRKFGRVSLLPRRTGARERFFQGLGLEPFTAQYNWPNFRRSLEGRKLALKSLLLDQAFVAGVGNIYADEALFESGLHPLRRVSTLRVFEMKALFAAIPLVLERGIHYGGTTLRDYVDSEGAEGRNRERLQVYGRKGLPCPRCGEEIRKIVVSQRGTHFCPRCQPRSRRPRRSSAA